MRSSLRSVLPHQVIPAVVYVATEMVGDGHVKHNGRGELVIGSSSDSEMIASVLSAAAIPTQVSENVIGALWAKLIVNCAYNALSAITQLPYGRLVQQEGVPRMMEELVVECLAVASADWCCSAWRLSGECKADCYALWQNKLHLLHKI
jgi:2-dehydropantoate 2-reductase